jgi:tetratricopeptide (TPR) repeat protein
MPAGKSDIPHASTTDHRIPRRAEPYPLERGKDRPHWDEMPLVPFYQEQRAAKDSDIARDLGIALMDRVERYPSSTRKALGQRALSLLESDLHTDESDLPAWEAKANALWSLGRTEEAAAAFEAILNRAPQREAVLHSAATLAMERERPLAACVYWERAIRVNPWRYEFHYGLAAARAQLRDWPGAMEECDPALRLNPFHSEVRKILIRCHLAMRAKGQARTEFERLLALDPSQAEALRRWYAVYEH